MRKRAGKSRQEILEFPLARPILASRQLAADPQQRNPVDQRPAAPRRLTGDRIDNG
jgi:hypothetical protein